MLICVSAALFLTPLAQANCFDLAAQRYQVPVQLLQAIAMQESGGRPDAINRSNANGSYDIGMMQINSFWLPRLARHGIQEKDLFDPCVSVLVGAWILSDNFARLGYNTQGLGAYNARSPDKRERYARAVLGRLGYVLPPVPRSAQSAAAGHAMPIGSSGKRPAPRNSGHDTNSRPTTPPSR
jgi:soluble lytic murein transglycosylase-like protein